MSISEDNGHIVNSRNMYQVVRVFVCDFLCARVCVCVDVCL